jgi:hypothetical protein
MTALTIVCLAAAQVEERIDAPSLRAWVERLAADEMKGRAAGSPECRRAADLVAARFKELGLAPAGTGGYYQRKRDWANVLALREGSDPKHRGECLVVGAHHDGQGVRDGRVFNSADDNASGTALMLEIAEAVAALDPPPKRAIAFHSYDGEEAGFIGSQLFTNSELFERRRVVAMICFDLVGGEFTAWEKNRIYALGAESSPPLARLLRARAAEEKAVQVVPAGVYMIDPLGPQLVGARSDYASFRAKGVPYVFFSTATPWYYHTPDDDPERLDYTKMQNAGRFVLRIVRELADSEEELPFVLGPTPVPSDAALMAEAFGKLLEHRATYRLTDEEAAAAAAVRARMSEIAGRPAVDKEAQGAIQRAMVTMFGYAKRRPQ